MKLIKPVTVLLGISVFLLVSCVKERDYTQFYKLEVAEKGNVQVVGRSTGRPPMPSIGVSKMLVVPVEFVDGPEWTPTMLENLEKTFFGETEDTYWESLKSFYQKSSFGKLNIEGELLPVMKSDVTVYDYRNGNSASYINLFAEPLHNSLDSEFLKQYDADSDGFVDAVSFIYSNDYYADSEFWAWVSQMGSGTPNKNKPVFNNHMWCSYKFVNNGSTKFWNDSHTLIHETGHLLGLEDLYDYDYSGASPAGAIDMMDNNVVDHNVINKWMLGWNKPYVVTGDARISLKPSQESGEFIIVNDLWNGSQMDEYIAIEYYTPTGLNEKDSEAKYLGAYPKGYDIPGIKIYHADFRVARYSRDMGNWSTVKEPVELSDIATGARFDFYTSNTVSFNRDKKVNDGYKMTRLMQPSGKDTLVSSKVPPIGNRNLWQADGTIFNPSSENIHFTNGTNFNNGKVFGYEIEVISITDEEAVIEIRKI
ncbi:MAG: hypothetical protein LBR37_00605 [Erysipelotrichaceae bacterium]|jgi:M6 family metalloprotease-like protein|nr:hypothetical protein [Erysipelotrichaceae bacterium]